MIMKYIVLAGFLIVAAAGHAVAQVDTFHLVKNGPVSVVEPRKLTNIAELNAPTETAYMVIAKTEIENRGANSPITCELVAVTVNVAREGPVFAGDPVTVFVPQGQFALAAMTFAAPAVPGTGDPDAPTFVRFRVRCGALGADSPTDFVVRQTKITAHKVSDLLVTTQ
jgi:hypothetical protein